MCSSDLEEDLETVVVDGDTAGPGNALLLEIESEHLTEVFSGFGEVGIRAEAVAEQATREARRYLAAGVPVGPHLADQLLVPLTLAGAGAFRTIGLSSHSRTNLDVIRLFSSTRIAARGDRDDVVVSFEA